MRHGPAHVLRCNCSIVKIGIKNINPQCDRIDVPNLQLNPLNRGP